MFSMVVTPVLTPIGGFAVITYQSLKQRWVTDVAEQQRAQGHAQGRAQGRAEANAEWRGWLQRREDASAQGIAFTEPPPSG